MTCDELQTGRLTLRMWRESDLDAFIKVAERIGEKLEGKTRLFDGDVLVYGIDRP